MANWHLHLQLPVVCICHVTFVRYGRPWTVQHMKMVKVCLPHPTSALLTLVGWYEHMLVLWGDYFQQVPTVH